MKKAAFDWSSLVGKQNSQMLGATLPWTLGGAAAGAGLGAGTYALEDPEKRKHDSLLGSMGVGAAMGGAAGTGIKALGGLANPSSLTSSSPSSLFSPPPAPPTGNIAGAIAAASQHNPGVVGGALGLGAGTWKSHIDTSKYKAGVEDIKETMKPLQKAQGGTLVNSVEAQAAVKPDQAEIDRLDRMLQGQSRILQQAESKIGRGQGLMHRLRWPVAGAAIGSGVASGLSDVYNDAQRYNVANDVLKQQAGQ